VIGREIANHVRVEYVFQELTDLPGGYTVPANREKPWGTAHAVLSCRHAVQEPFAVINADDFYGAEAFQTLADHLRHTDPTSRAYCFVAYVLRNTLSDHGTVTRGICDIEDGKLVRVIERHKIEPHLGHARFLEDEVWHDLSGEEPASMNMWGFTPALFGQIEQGFPAFLEEAAGNPKAEYLLPSMVDQLISAGEATVHALHTDAQWLGVTYPEDKAVVSAGLRELTEKGAYARNVWSGMPEGA
jgi:dTDP-glucose pyrophosphorylase